MTGDRTTVLFLCTGNSCRSQMAEGLLRHIAAERYDALSAGLEPTPLHPMAVQVMAEIGIDISGQRSKAVKEFLGRAKVDVAVFVCSRAEERCPNVYPFALEKLSWPFDDPAAFRGSPDETIQRFREIRDEIAERITEWLDERHESREVR